MRAAGAKAVVGAALVLLGACAETGSWQNAKLPQEQWALDKADCQRRARDQVEREYALSEQTARPGVTAGTSGASGQWQSDMNRFSAGKRERRLFESCMTGKGYTFVKGDGGSDAEPESEPAAPAGEAK
jgi:hypothetical protein